MLNATCEFDTGETSGAHRAMNIKEIERKRERKK